VVALPITLAITTLIRIITVIIIRTITITVIRTITIRTRHLFIRTFFSILGSAATIDYREVVSFKLKRLDRLIWIATYNYR